jgi:hypothetical protein
MKLHPELLHSLVSSALLSSAICATSEQYDGLSDDAVVVLLALAELHEKNHPTPSLELVFCQTLYSPDSFLEDIDQLHKAGLLIRDGEKVAATDKGMLLLKAVYDNVQHEMQCRATKVRVMAQGAANPLIQDNSVDYGEPLTLFPLRFFAMEPTKEAKPSASMRREQPKDIVNG